MKKQLIILFILTIFLAKAQEKKMSLSLSTPLLIAKYETNYKGVAGLKYRYFFKNKGKYNYGLSFNFDYFQNKGIEKNAYKDQKFFYHNFNVFRKFTFKSFKKTSITTTIGYTFLASNAYAVYNYQMLNEQIDTTRSHYKSNGFNTGLTADYMLGNTFFITGTYKYNYAAKPATENCSAVTFEANLFSLGLGFYF